jgi:transposase
VIPRDPTLPYAIFLARSDRHGYEGGVTQADVATRTTTTAEWRGPVLDVLRQMLTDYPHAEQVLSIFEQLVARNGELELQLGELLSRRNKGEGISTDQLLLFLDRLSQRHADNEGKPADQPCAPATEEANQRLRAASGIDAKCSDEPGAKPAKPPPQPSIRKPLPDHLERVPFPIAVPADQRPCPICGGERECIGHDVTEVAELRTAEIFVRVEMREKLWCEPCDGAITRAPVGDRVVAGGRMGPTLVAQLLVDKYEDGLPLHRQKQRFARMGLDTPVSTLGDQVRWGAELLMPLWRAAQREVLAARVMHVDGTGMPVLVRDKKTHKKIGTGKRLGTLWGYVGGETAVFLYCSTGHAQGKTKDDIGPEQFLAQRNGYVVADAASVFEKTFKCDGIIECGCNMHGRRKFIAALEGGDERAALPLAGFKKLYQIEDNVRALDDDARLDVRQKESRPVYDSLMHWCRVYQDAGTERPSSPLAKAIGYMINQEAALKRFLEDGCIPIDNGEAERLHVRVALTRKNQLFVGSDAGGRRAAIVYTILGCCRRAGVDPVRYLADVLPRLARGVREADITRMLPAVWRDQRAAEKAATQAAAETENAGAPAADA